MKKVITISLLATFTGLTATSLFAKDCNDFSVDSNWPLNQVKTIISCDKVDGLSSSYGGDSACVIVTDDQVSAFNTTSFRINFFRNGDSYSTISSLVSKGRNGYKDIGKMTTNGDGSTSFESLYAPNSLILKNTINLINPTGLKLAIIEKSLFKTKTIETSDYRCHRIK